MAEDIARGELDIRADETQSQDEIGQLAVVFSEMSAALRDSYGRLEERVRQRTEELETANIGLEAQIVWRERVEKAMNQQAQELARSNAELEQFAYVASHDLQEPLRKVLAFGDLLHSRSDDALDDTGRNYLERMQDASRRMRALIEALLTYARVTSHGNPFVTVDLGEVTREVVSDLEVTIASSGGRVELGDLPSIEADPTQMRQLLQNLISNGLKFSRPGERPALAVHGQLLNGHAGSENDMPTAAVTRDKVQLTVGGRRHRIRPKARRPHLHHLPAPARPRRIRGHRDRAGHRAKDRRASQRSDHRDRQAGGRRQPSSSRCPSGNRVEMSPVGKPRNLITILILWRTTTRRTGCWRKRR